MWAEAAKAIAKFDEGVLSAVDGAGYPLSVRQTSLRYDAATGVMPVALPEALGAAPGPASLLCHYHDENLWNMRMISVRGRLECRDGGFVFVTTAFEPPSTLKQMLAIGRNAKRYLQKRGLPRPEVRFDVIERLWTQVKARPRG